MIRRFNFDYDFENDDLFLFDPKSKSKASIEIGDFIIDYNSNNEISAIEMLNASVFFKGIKGEVNLNKNTLKDINDCKIAIVRKNNFLMIQLIMTLTSKEQIITPFYIPSITQRSPALAGF